MTRERLMDIYICSERDKQREIISESRYRLTAERFVGKFGSVLFWLLSWLIAVE